MRNRAHNNSIMKSNFLQLQSMLDEFSALLSDYAIDLQLFKLPRILLDETHAEPEIIPILQRLTLDEQGKEFLRKAFSTLKIDALKYSTYLAHRFPGFVVLPTASQAEVVSYINEINKRKDEFHDSVKQDFKKRQNAHENLHKCIENVVLLSATRHIRCTSAAVNTVNFYWQHKTIQRIVPLDEAKLSLENAKNNQVFEYTLSNRDDKLAFIDKEIEQLSHVPVGHNIVEIRQTRVQPFIDLWTRHVGATANKKVSSTNASLPMILFGEPPSKVNALSDYNRGNVNFKEIPYSLINARKYWYAVPCKQPRSS